MSDQYKQLENGVQPAAGYWGDDWQKEFAIPDSLSTGGFTLQDRGYKQQTFLGASIKSFGMKAGFGDTSSTANLQLVEDEFNKSDTQPQGKGDDVYHNGKHDKFVPPFVGSPVFFKFGKDFATVEEAFRPVFEHIYSGISTSSGVTIEDGSYSGPISGVPALQENEYYDIEQQKTVKIVTDENIGRGHLTFGGILQSVTENTSPQGNKIYNASLTDPREILDCVTLVLNNYAGSIQKTDNIFNLYGYLEFNLPESVEKRLSESFTKDVIIREVDQATGEITYKGTDCWLPEEAEEGSGDTDLLGMVGSASDWLTSWWKNPADKAYNDVPFPITGTGFARRSNAGIPFYRVLQSLVSIFGFNRALPEEYVEMSFGDKINFRGFKYVVDLSGLPDVPDFYQLDFDEISLLDLCLEMCEIANKDLFVTLLPVIDHPSCAYLHSQNKQADDKDLVVGIIRIECIDRTKQPELGAIKKYLDELEDEEIYVKNKDIGYELSNITTDKFVIGGQEVNMHFFSSAEDKDKGSIGQQKKDGAESNLGNQWKVTDALKQQMVPYYGTLGNNFVALPRGYGASQQILLESSNLMAYGVGNYYVATEMELRCALAGYDRWVQYLILYNDKYMEPFDGETGGGNNSINPIDEINGEFNKLFPNGIPASVNADNYTVTVPRSVFKAYHINEEEATRSCNPPFGWPLYYNRATILGIPQAGLVSIQHVWRTQVLPDLKKLRESVNDDQFKIILNSTWTDNIKNSFPSKLAPYLDAFVGIVEEAIEAGTIALVEDRVERTMETGVLLNKLQKRGTNNAKRVHKFLYDIASECLGKKYLIKLPKQVNLGFDPQVQANGGVIDSITSALGFGSSNGPIQYGPFGFRPIPITSEPLSKQDSSFVATYQEKAPDPLIKSMLGSGLVSGADGYNGALNSSYNPFSDRYDFSYYPEPEGGFFPEDIYKEILPLEKLAQLQSTNALFGKLGMSHIGLHDQIIPLDLGNFINDNNRISAYVRFDNSQFLSFTSFRKGDFIQEKIINNNLIADFSESLDNVKSSSDKFYTFNFSKSPTDNEALESEEPSIAFVKCSVDSKLYYSPPIVEHDGEVYGGDVDVKMEITKPVNTFNKQTKKYETVLTHPRAYITPAFTSQSFTVADDMMEYKTITKKTFENNQNGTDMQVIDTEINEKEINDIYALITLPGSVEPTKDARFRDGPYQLTNGPEIKHFLTMDVVKEFDAFEDLKYAVEPEKIDVTDGICDNRENMKNEDVVRSSLMVNPLALGFPQQIAFKVPSPVVPDLAVIPLRSTERCYGPWCSQWIDTRTEKQQLLGAPLPTRFIELGGQVDFIKEESLAPWNYAGYSNMNTSGKLKAQFSNNLLLLSERGGFAYPDAPKNVYLAEELKERGPLVTSVNVNISDQGIITTVELDLYTVSFGKLHKHKEEKIKQISREQQKIKDEKNALVRKSMGKNQKSQDYIALYDKIEADMKKVDRFIEMIQGITNNPANLVSTTKKIKTKGSVLDTGKETDIIRTGNEMTIQNVNQPALTSENFADLPSAARSYQNTAGGALSDVFTGVSEEPRHVNLPFNPQNYNEAKQKLYPNVSSEDLNIDNDDLQIYED